jgi:predicted nucleic acid-binding protein
VSVAGVLLDACVLVNASLRDTLLRVAQQGLYRPFWSEEIIEELSRTLQLKLGKSARQTERLVQRLSEHFDDAWVRGYEPLIPKMENDAGDRHVLASAVHADERIIVTFNLRHFPESALEPWLIEAQHPDEFLVDLYRRHSETLVHVLQEQAQAIRKDIRWLLAVQRQGMPQFAELVAEGLSLDPMSGLPIR